MENESLESLCIKIIVHLAHPSRTHNSHRFFVILEELSIPSELHMNFLAEMLANYSEYVDIQEANTKYPTIRINDKGKLFAENADDSVSEYNEYNRKKILDLLKDEINKKDSARVGWAIEVILKRQPADHVIAKVSAAITSNREYLKEHSLRFPKDWNIVRNPNYELEQNVKSTNDSIITLNTVTIPKQINSQWWMGFWSLMLAAVSVLFIAITAYLQYRDTLPSKVELMSKEVKETSKALKEMHLSLKEINSSIEKLKNDSVPKSAFLFKGIHSPSAHA